MLKSFITEATRPSAAAHPAPQTPEFQESMLDAAAAPHDQKIANGETKKMCDYRACAATYQSFNTSDCTFQPYSGGPRQRCEKGETQVQQLSEGGSAPADPSQATLARCNVSACVSAYSSFRPSDCTYQPLDGGPREICEKAAIEGPLRSTTKSRVRPSQLTRIPADQILPNDRDKESSSASGESSGEAGSDLPRREDAPRRARDRSPTNYPALRRQMLGED
jgi:hypothetical protein